MTDPYALPFEGAIPFLIDWGQTSHPAKTAPHAGKLIQLSIAHPQHELVSRHLNALGISLPVRPSDRYALTALIDTGRSIIELK